MGPYAFSQAFLCGFFAFAALSALAWWWGTRHDRALLTLAIVCCIGSVQAYAGLGLASATTVIDAQRALQLRSVCGVRAEDAAFLQKPYTPTGLTAKVREILDQHPRRPTISDAP